MTTARRLKAVPGSKDMQSKCGIVVQAVLAGPVETRVQAMTPVVGPGHGSISVRLGRVVVVLEDRPAYESLRRAWEQVEELVDQALPQLPRPAYKPRRNG